MKLGPYEFRRTPPEEPVVLAAASPNGKARTKEIGASGTIASDGYLQSSDYNSQLTGMAALRMWQRMRLSDASVRESLQHITSPILDATWDVEAASDDPLDLEVAEFGRRCFHDWLDEPFGTTMRTALLFLPQGFQVFEVVEQVVDAELSYDPPLGERVTLPKRQFICWKRFAHRRPETITRWITDGGELKAIQQTVMSEGRFDNPEIPANRLLVFTHEKEGDEFTGLSILRSAYKAWHLKELVEKIAGIAYERHGVGIPVGYLPESLRNDDAALTQLEHMLQNMRAGESHYLAFPGPKAGSTAMGTDGYLVEILSPQGGIPDFMPFLEYLRGEIKGNVLARFAELGHGSVGARATGDVQSQVWYTALQATADYVTAVFNRALKDLVDRNYQVESYPQLVARDLEARNLAEYSDAVSKLVGSGSAIADRSLRSSVRDYMGWPDEDEPDEAGQLDTMIEELPTEIPPTPPEQSATAPDVANPEDQKPQPDSKQA